MFEYKKASRLWDLEEVYGKLFTCSKWFKFWKPHLKFISLRECILYLYRCPVAITQSVSIVKSLNRVLQVFRIINVFLFTVHTYSLIPSPVYKNINSHNRVQIAYEKAPGIQYTLFSIWPQKWVILKNTNIIRRSFSLCLATSGFLYVPERTVRARYVRLISSRWYGT